MFCRANRLEKYQGPRIFWAQGSTTLQIPLCSLKYVNLGPISCQWFLPQGKQTFSCLSGENVLWIAFCFPSLVWCQLFRLEKWVILLLSLRVSIGAIELYNFYSLYSIAKHWQPLVTQVILSFSFAGMQLFISNECLTVELKNTPFRTKSNSQVHYLWYRILVCYYWKNRSPLTPYILIYFSETFQNG